MSESAKILTEHIECLL